MSSDQLELIANIYDTAIDPSRWTVVLDRLAASVGAIGSIVVAVESLDESVYTVRATNSLYDPKELDFYYHNYGHYELPAWNSIKDIQAGVLLTYEDIWPEKSEYLNRPDVLWTQDNWGYIERAAIKLNNEKAWTDAVTFQFATAHGNITPSEIETAQIFIPHLAKSVELARGFSILKARFNAVLAALDRFRIGQYLVLPSGSIVLANATGRDILDARNGIRRTSDNRLTLDDGNLARKFASALATAARTANSESAEAATNIRVAKYGGGDAYAVEVAPLRDSEGEIDRSFKGAIVTVIDPDRGAVVSIAGMDRLYGLTTAEIAIVQLIVDGLSTSDIADSRSTSPGTVRQQIKSILQKTDCRNRTDLVRRALVVNLPIDRE